LGERMGEESSGLEALSWGERDVSCTSIVVSTKDKRWVLHRLNERAKGWEDILSPRPVGCLSLWGPQVQFREL
jgi:hypothetical protein